MKKRVLSLVFTAVLCVSFCVSALDVKAEEKGGEPESAGRGTLLYETDVVTRKDFEEGFQNYALSEATVDFASEIHTYSGGEPANVVGVVKDYETEEMISGAVVSVDGETVVVTGEDGRFQIKNFPSGVYDWQISAAGYYTADYTNYDVDYLDGATIFTFYISDDFAVQKDREEVLYGDACGQSMQTEAAGEEACETLAVSASMTSPPSISSYIKVYYNEKINYVGREQYVYTVLSSELRPASFYKSCGLNDKQRIELYMAQAIAANTFIEYSLSVYSNHPNTGYNVCSLDCCQVYDPTKVTQEAINATSYIFYSIGDVEACDMIMYKPSGAATYAYMCSQFFSSCLNKGTEPNPNEPAEEEVSCTDIVFGKEPKKRYGMCQMGAAKRARDEGEGGESASEILAYYYKDIEIVLCPLK